MTKVRSLLTSFALFSLSSSLSLAATGGRLLTCRVPFDYDSAEVEQDFVAQCIKNLQLTSRDTLQVVASATPQGTRSYNEALSKKRAENLSKAFVARVPGLEVRAIAIGPIPKNGLLAQASAPETTTGTSGMTKEASAPGTGYWKVGPRLGRDRTFIEEKTSYFAPGVELSYVPTLANPNMYAEFSLLGNVYTFVDNTKMTSVHLAPMLGYIDPGSGMIAGLRGLGGLVSSNVTKSDLGDGGAELRIGKQTRQWTAFLGVGQTRILQRVGVDLGYRF